MKIHIVLLAIAVVIAAISVGDEALLVEYISQYKIKTNDLQSVIDNQLSHFTIGNVKTSYATISQSSFSFNYVGRSSEYNLSPIKVQIVGDKYSFNLMFNVSVKQVTGLTKNYSCHFTPGQPIEVNYTKEVSLASGTTIIGDYVSSFGGKTFDGDAICTSKETDKDKTRIHEIVSGTQSSSVYLELKKGIDKLKSWMQDNSQNQHLSQIFPDNPYHYTFYSYSVDVNVSTVGTEKYQDTGVVNKIRATIPGASHFTGSLPSKQQGYNLFFTNQFILNLIDNSLANDPKWKGIKCDKSNIRSRTFKFRLADYEYIIPSVLQKYPKNYLQDTWISCDVVSYKNMKINPGKSINFEFTWSCKGSFMDGNTTVNFLNFTPTLLYQVTINVPNRNYLTVYEKAKSIVDLNFNIVDGMEIEDPYLFKMLIDQILFEFQGYPVGQFFKVKDGSSMVKIASQGVWVG